VAIRANRYALWRQLAGWIAAYALVLHAFLAALAPVHNASHAFGDEAYVFCANDAGSSIPAPGGIPAGTDDCDSQCTLAQGPGALFVRALDFASASIIEFETASVPWPDDPITTPTRIRIICKPPRGPPQAA
jgi:hypothetical protein